MDLNRVVQVFSRDAKGEETTGSGYLLSPRAVLTASHVIGRSVADVQVESRSGMEWVAGVDRAIDLGNDVSILVCSSATSAVLGVAPQLGGLGRRAVELDCVAVGFPNHALQRSQQAGAGSATGDVEPGAYLRGTQVSGEFSTATGFDDRSITLFLDPNSRPQVVPPSGMSAFAGFSGAALFVSGYLVGVVTRDPSPDHPTILEGVRLEGVFAEVADHRVDVLEDLRRVLVTPVVLPFEDITVNAQSRATRAAQLAQVQTIVDAIDGHQLIGRGAEMEEMQEFCVDPDRMYLVWHADEWAGKTALLATFVAEAPRGVDVISFFINRNRPDQRSARDYLDSVSRQLEAYLDEAPTEAYGAFQRGRYLELLKRASHTAINNGRSLVLVVDALDEDLAFEPGHPGEESIVSLLPNGIPGLHVVVATRPYQHVLEAANEHHPFRKTPAVRLEASPFAASIRDEARQQIRAVAQGGDRTERSILGFLAGAGVGLCANDLAAMIGAGNDEPVPPAQVLHRLHTNLSRVVRRAQNPLNFVEATSYQEPYEWSHETIPRSVEDDLGSEYIERYRRRLSHWVDAGLKAGWNQNRSPFFESGYPQMLIAASDLDRLVECAVDFDRHDWLYSRRGGDDQAQTEINNAIQLGLRSSQPRDVAELVALRFAQARLSARSDSLPSGLLQLLVRLGYASRAIARASHLAAAKDRAVALAAVAEALIGVGNSADAMRVIAVAERVAVGIADELSRADALTAVAGPLAMSYGGEAVRVLKTAEAAAAGIPDPVSKARVFESVASGLASADDASGSMRVLAIVEQVATDIPDDHSKAEAFTRLAAVLASLGRVNDAVRVADGIPDDFYKAPALAGVVHALAGVGKTEDAERVAARISVDSARSRALAELVAVLAERGNLADAERIAGNIADDFSKVHALTGVARVLALGNEDRADAAVHMLAAAERTAAGMTGLTSELWRAQAMTEVARAYADAGSISEAERVLTDAEREAAEIGHSFRRAGSLARVAAGMASLGKASDAERVVDKIDDDASNEKVKAFTEVATALVGYGNANAAERMAGRITDPALKAKALSEVARTRAEAGNTGEAVRVLGDAERAAQEITEDQPKAQAFVEVASILAVVEQTIDAERVIAIAEGVAADSKNDDSIARARLVIADALASAGHVANAEKIAAAITNNIWRAAAFSGLADALGRAGNASDAQRVAARIPDDDWKAQALLRVAEGLAETAHLADAERVATGITADIWKAAALARVAGGLMAAQQASEGTRVLVMALVVANGITRDSSRAHAWLEIARRLVGVPGAPEGLLLAKAESEAAAIAILSLREGALAQVAGLLADTGDTAGAERVANAITDDSVKSEALMNVVAALVESRQGANVARIAAKIDDDYWKVKLATAFAAVLQAEGKAGEAVHMLAGAEQIATQIPDEYSRDQALTEIAAGLARTSTARDAGRVVAKITHGYQQTKALTAVAAGLAATGRPSEAEDLGCQGLLGEDWAEYTGLLASIATADGAGVKLRGWPVRLLQQFGTQLRLERPASPTSWKQDQPLAF